MCSLSPEPRQPSFRIAARMKPKYSFMQKGLRDYGLCHPLPQRFGLVHKPELAARTLTRPSQKTLPPTLVKKKQRRRRSNHTQVIEIVDSDGDDVQPMPAPNQKCKNSLPTAGEDSEDEGSRYNIQSSQSPESKLSHKVSGDLTLLQPGTEFRDNRKDRESMAAFRRDMNHMDLYHGAPTQIIQPESTLWVPPRTPVRPPKSLVGRGKALEGPDAGVVLVEATPEEAPSSSLDSDFDLSTQLYEHPMLTAHGLVINKTYGLLICHHCEQAITPHAITYHLNQGIGMGVPSPTIAEMERIAQKQNVPYKTYPTIDTCNGPVTAIAGLKIQRKTGCPRCMYTASATHVRQHMINICKCPLTPPLKNVTCQVLNEGAANSSIRIIPPPIPQPTQTLEAMRLREFQTFDPLHVDLSTSPDDSRLLSPWILRTRFHTLAEGRDVDKLRELVSLPSETELHLRGLGKAVLQYFQECESLLDDTDPFVLQIFNTSDVDKDGINHTPLHNHHQPEPTLQAYSLPITHLVSSIIRQGFDDFKLPTSAEVIKAVKSLKRLIDSAHLHDLFISLWLQRWPWTKEKPFADPTICFLGLYTIKKDGSFSQPKDVMGVIAKLCRALRLTVLRQAHEFAEQQGLTILDVYTQYEPWLVESKPSTFQSLRFYQHYATSLAYGTISPPTYLMTFMNKIEKKVVKLVEDDILCGLDLHARISDPADNLQSTEPGYSFLTDSRNDFYDSHLTLVEKFLTGDTAKRRFFRPIPGTTQDALNVSEALNWLEKLAECEGLLALLIEMRSGSPIRLTELTSTLARNTRYRSRNLFAIGNHTVLIRQYNKTSNNEQADRLIPHSLSSFDADILAQIHLLARPFAAFLASKLYPNDPEVSRMYLEQLFMDLGKAFTSRKLSDLMGRETLAVFLFRITISMWRHIATAWRTKLCAPTDVDEDLTSVMKQFQAQQSGHTLATEQRIYGLSPDVIEGISDATIQLYLKVSTEWQMRLQVVPGGHVLTYREAMMDNFDSLVKAELLKLFPARSGGEGATNDQTLQLLQQLVVKQSHNQEVLIGKIDQLQKEMSTLKKAIADGSVQTLQLSGPSVGDTLVEASSNPPHSSCRNFLSYNP
ncbi:hypothetical protein H1R20_g9314, partial [Candolleomyces eurysporus]